MKTGTLRITIACFLVALLFLMLAGNVPAQTTYYVNAETGSDSNTGLLPGAAFKTITKALTTIKNTPPASGAPYTVRIAGRWGERCDFPWIYGITQIQPPPPYALCVMSSGETFPLDVPPRTLLKADAANSEWGSDGNLVPVIIEGPLTCTGASCAPPDTLQFRAGGQDPGDHFTNEGGLDGSEIAPYGIEVRGGARNVYIEADGSAPAHWATGPPPLPLIPSIFIRIEGVWFSGSRGSTSAGAFDLDAHIVDGGVGNFTVSNCKFTTDASVPVTTAWPVANAYHTGQALIHIYSEDTPQPGGGPVLQPSFSNNVLTVVENPNGSLPQVDWGMLIQSQTGPDVYVNVSSLDLDGAAETHPNTGGLLAGIEFASNTGNGSGKIPRFDLNASDVRNCAIYGAALGTGTSGTNTVTRVEFAGNSFTGNGKRPVHTDLPSGGSTHQQYPGAAIHMVCRDLGSWFIGSVNSNVISGNVTGITFATSSTQPSGAVTLPPGVPGFTISRNNIWGQVAFPPLPASYQLPATAQQSDGVGIILGDDGIYAAGTPGALTIATPLWDFVLDANQIHENLQHGLWIVAWVSQSDVSPRHWNNLIYENGSVTTMGDGVRIELMPAAAVVGTRLASVHIHETIRRNYYGYGVNNIYPGPPSPGGTISTPELWNSIVYFNNTGGPSNPASGPDLNGFNFPNVPPLPGGVVRASDFCGLPHNVGCGSLFSATPATFRNISYDPQFWPVTFDLICASGGSPPLCNPPTCQSPCIDTADPNAPVVPSTDFNGLPRPVSLTSSPGPDMGAVEKQYCSP